MTGVVIGPTIFAFTNYYIGKVTQSTTKPLTLTLLLLVLNEFWFSRVGWTTQLSVDFWLGWCILVGTLAAFMGCIFDLVVLQVRPLLSWYNEMTLNLVVLIAHVFGIGVFVCILFIPYGWNIFGASVSLIVTMVAFWFLYQFFWTAAVNNNKKRSTHVAGFHYASTVFDHGNGNGYTKIIVYTVKATIPGLIILVCLAFQSIPAFGAFAEVWSVLIGLGFVAIYTTIEGVFFSRGKSIIDSVKHGHYGMEYDTENAYKVEDEMK